MAEEVAIDAVGVTKSFGGLTVLAGVDLAIAPGTVFSLLGPNGAGKTTMVRILSTLLRPDRGRARVAGFDVVRERHRVRQRISLTGQDVAIDALQTGEENLRMVGRLAGLSGGAAKARARDLLDRFDLGEAGRRPVKTYSGGMRRRLDLAAGLVGRPAVIFLDEPTTGLDPRSRQATWDIVGDLTGSGVTVFLTTQYLEEADRLADRIAVLDGGRVVADGTAADLKRRVAEQRLELTLADAAGMADVAARLGDRVLRADGARRVLAVATDGGAAHIRALLDEVDPARRAVLRFAVHTPTLDDVFLTLTGHRAGGPDAVEEVSAGADGRRTVHV